MPITKRLPQKKVEDLARIRDWLAQSTFAVFTDYRGLTVQEMTQLRRQLRSAGVELHVVKNTLTGLAARDLGITDLDGWLVGPTALAFTTQEDVAAAAKALTEATRAFRVLAIKGGLLQRRLISVEQIQRIAELPPRPVLISQVIGTMQAPMANLVGVLSATLRSLVYVLEARRRQLAGEAA